MGRIGKIPPLTNMSNPELVQQHPKKGPGDRMYGIVRRISTGQQISTSCIDMYRVETNVFGESLIGGMNNVTQLGSRRIRRTTILFRYRKN